MHSGSWIVLFALPAGWRTECQKPTNGPFYTKAVQTHHGVKCKSFRITSDFFLKNLEKKNRITNSAEINQSFCFGVQARDPSVHAAILAHLNQKYGSGSGADPSSPEKNKVVSRTKSEIQSFPLGDAGVWRQSWSTKSWHTNQKHFIYASVWLLWGFFCCFFFSQTNAKEKDVPKPTTDLSEDLFKVHDFDVKIDLQVPSAGDDSPGLFLVPRRGSWLCMWSTMCSTVCVLQRPSLCLSVQTHCLWRTAPPGGPSTWRTTRKEGAWSDASASSFGIHNACVIAWECVCVRACECVRWARGQLPEECVWMSIQRTVDPHTEEILIEQQIIILPGFFSAERCPGGIVLVVYSYTNSYWVVFFLCSYLPPNLNPVFDFREDTYGSLPSRGTLF